MYLFQDFGCNKDIKIKIVLLMFRFGSLLYKKRRQWTPFPYFAFGFFYRVIVEWILSIELPLKTNIGSRLTIYHGFGLVVNCCSVIGSDVIMRNGVIIGNSGRDSGVPVISDGVEIGGNAVIIGGVKVGRCAKIGAGSVVTKDVPDGVTVVSARNRYL